MRMSSSEDTSTGKGRKRPPFGIGIASSHKTFYAALQIEKEEGSQFDDAPDFMQNRDNDRNVQVHQKEEDDDHMEEIDLHVDPIISSSKALPYVTLHNAHDSGTPVKSFGHIAPPSKDGVFFNMSAKPSNKNHYELVKDEYQGDEQRRHADYISIPIEQPPEYDVVASLCPPDYAETLIIPERIDTIIVEGSRVGSWSIFFWCCAVSFVFELVGFAMCFLLTDTIAGQCGGLFGLGLNIISSVCIPRSRNRYKGKPGDSTPPPTNIHNHDAVVMGLIIGSIAMSGGLIYFTYARKIAGRRLNRDFMTDSSAASAVVTEISPNAVL